MEGVWYESKGSMIQIKGEYDNNQRGVCYESKGNMIRIKGKYDKKQSEVR